MTSVMYARGVTCFSCHDVHGTNNAADLVRPATTVCLQCHGPASPNGPHTTTIEQHTHHKAGSDTLRFIPPSASEKLKVPNACTTCHADRSNAWAIDMLKSWPEFSPWRVR